jgi:hypothetical protein
LAPELVPRLTDFLTAASVIQGLSLQGIGNAISVVTDGSSGFTITIGDTGGADIAGRAVLTATAGVITSALIVLRDSAVTLDTILHEMAHAFGLAHHNGTGVMGTSQGALGAAFSLAERDNVTMMFRVPANTALPAGDAGVALSGARASTTVLVRCRR